MKLAGVIILAVVSSIVLGVIALVTSSRESTQKEAVTAIGQSWGLEQRVAGPFLVVPYKRIVPSRASTEVREALGYLAWIPDRLQIDSRVQLEKRKRGIFEAAVYANRLKVSGSASVPSQEELGGLDAEILWDQAAAVFFVSDPRGIKGDPDLHWGNKKVELIRGTGYASFLAQGIYAPLRNLVPGTSSTPFSLDLEVRGTQKFSLAPAASLTQVKMDAGWPDPSFTGSFLPDTKEISSDRFSAEWNISRLAQPLPQLWISEQQADEKTAAGLDRSYFGVEFVDAVSPYRSILRSVKYGVLVVALTFLTFFLFEMLSGLRIHPVQYLSVGAALATFYLLLLSLAEHFGFDWSYLAAGAATVGLISGYSYTVLGGGKRTLILGGLLTVLYIFFYILMQIEDYALLAGTLALFAALALFMYLTRKIDWYEASRLSFPGSGES